MLAEKMTTDALYETCRALADRGEDYGWNAYYNGTRIPPSVVKKIVADGGAGWLEAFRAALAAYRKSTGSGWSY